MRKIALVLFAILLVLSLAACGAVENPRTSEDYAVYAIYYHAEGGELSPYNPVAYNSLTPSFTLKAPTRSGYRFLGWSRSEDLSSPVLNLEVPKGTTGNLDFFAAWGELYSIRVDSASPEFYTVEYVTGPVLSGEVATVRIYTAEPVSRLSWWGIGSSWQAPDSCEYDEALGCFVARFTLTGDASVMVEGVI